MSVGFALLVCSHGAPQKKTVKLAADPHSTSEARHADDDHLEVDPEFPDIPHEELKRRSSHFTADTCLYSNWQMIPTSLSQMITQTDRLKALAWSVPSNVIDVIDLIQQGSYCCNAVAGFQTHDGRIFS